jgi:hypothetical protein
MIEGWTVFALVCLLVVGPIAWRVVHDRREQRALAVTADMRHVVNKALDGESLVSIQVEPATVWRSGRVVLSVPADWRWLLDRAWRKVLTHLPSGYELVVQLRPAVPGAEAPRPQEYRAAA